MKLYLIRHGETKGNREHRYVGSTEESLLWDAKQALAAHNLPNVDKLYVSPRKRCLETASILYPDKQQQRVEEFRECDFGSFEYKDYQELKEEPAYHKFLASMGESGFPDGENKAIFQKRCVDAFQRILDIEVYDCNSIALVVHGGTIMALLDYYSNPHQDYYEWQVKNGEGFVVELLQNDKGKNYLTVLNKIEKM